jgi:hypothetical protein
MKFSFTHKINLANIDRELWPYETEDISISDADSFEEAQQKVDRLVAERLGYYKALSEQAKAAKRADTPSGIPTRPVPTWTPPAPSTTPAAPVATAPAPAVPIRPQGSTTGMPQEFQID